MDESLLKIQNAEILVVDLDGTLIDTNQANLLAYQAATLEVTGKALPEQALSYERLTRNRLRKILHDLPADLFDAIVQRKEVLYSQFLHTTELNTKLYQLLQGCQDKVLVLATNARQARAEQLLHQHHLHHLFAECYYHDEAQPNKFKQIFARFRGKKIIVFENEAAQASLALAAGAHPHNIIMVNAL